MPMRDASAAAFPRLAAQKRRAACAALRATTRPARRIHACGCCLVGESQQAVPSPGLLLGHVFAAAAVGGQPRLVLVLGQLAVGVGVGLGEDLGQAVQRAGFADAQAADFGRPDLEAAEDEFVCEVAEASSVAAAG